jgi:hypothetical protein
MTDTPSGYAFGKALAEVQSLITDWGKDMARGCADTMPKTRKLSFRERCVRAWSAFKVREV